MSDSELKRRMLHQAVADNVDVREGRRSPRPEPATPADSSTPGRSPHVSRLLLAAVLAGLLAAAGLTFALRPSPEVPVATAPADATTLTTAVESAASRPGTVAAAPTDLADLTFPAPPPLAPDVFPVAVRRVVLDPGHGGEYLGAVEGDLREKDLTLDIASRLRDRLEEDGFEVLMTREEDRAVTLKERAQMANEARADVFVSIHINWMSARRIRGIETYLIGPTDDPELQRLARLENHDSGYTMADMRDLVDGVYASFRHDTSRRLAARVQRSLFRSLREVNPELVDRGVKTAPFVVLVATEMPAILAEVSCLSNPRDAELLSRPLYREHIAEALHRGVRGFADEMNQIEEKGS